MVDVQLDLAGAAIHMIRFFAQTDVPPPIEVPIPGADSGGGALVDGIAGFVIVAIAVGLILFMWRRRAGRRSAAALERVAEQVDPTAPSGRYPKPARGAWDRGGAEVAQAEAFLSAVPRRCLGCGRFAGIAGAARPLIDICASCEGRVSLALGDGQTEVRL